MFLGISSLAALVGLVLAAIAAFGPETGVNGTPGAFLAFLGAATVVLILGILITAKLSAGMSGAWIALMTIAAFLTAVAAWFLMQEWLVGAMTVSILAFFLNGSSPQRRTVK